MASKQTMKTKITAVTVFRALTRHGYQLVVNNNGSQKSSEKFDGSPEFKKTLGHQFGSVSPFMRKSAHGPAVVLIGPRARKSEGDVVVHLQTKGRLVPAARLALEETTGVRFGCR